MVTPMTLEEYLAQSKQDRFQFARLIGRSPEAVRRYLKGHRTPDRGTMARILLVTEGQVTPNDFFRVAA
jgi:hypothetical protein